MERIADLVHALPPPGAPIEVADVPGGAEAAAWLTAHGRPARLVPPPPEAAETRLWEPSPGLVEGLQIGFADAGTSAFGGDDALDIGCGTGRDAVFLAMRGWRVVAVDRLPDALDRARLLADLHGVALGLLALDAERDPLPEGPFDLVTVFRYLVPLERMASVLAPGGLLVAETFTDRERARTGKPKDPRLVLPADASPPLPEGMGLLAYRVAEHGGRELATLIARSRTPLPAGGEGGG